MDAVEQHERRWEARPFRAALIRAFVLIAPIAASIVYVYVVSRLLPKPASTPLFVARWVGLSATATLVVVGIDRLTRRLLPLAALFRLSLLFPDRAPSRFRTAMRTGTVKTMEERLADVRSGRAGETPAEAAERLLGLVAALDTHDRLTRGHSERVRAYTRMIGEELRLSKHELDLLNWAALLHDVGKLKVPEEILNKPGKPTEEEWKALRLHPVYGAQLVEPLRAWLGEWTAAVSQHHERWDGKGYPAGLAGEKIAIAGRIVAVADVFDVITSARSYKEASGATEAREEMARCAGTQFDPRIVRALLSVSLGRLRFAMGPLSWLANAPILGRLPLTPAATTLAASAAAVVAAATIGLLPASAPAAAAGQPLAHAHAPAVHHLARTPPPHRAVAPSDSPPAPTADHAETPEDTAVLVPVLANDSDPDGDVLHLVDATAVSSGDVQVRHGGVEYTPPPNYAGSARFAYAVSDGTSLRRAEVHVDVLPVNDAPTAVPDEGAVPENWVAVIDAAANDTDPEGDQLAVVAVADVTTGSAAVADGKIRYEPPTDYVGPAALTYTVSDGHGGTDHGAVTITVTPVNSAPSFAPGPDVSVPEDSGPHGLPWAARIKAGAAWEAGQTVGFEVRNDEPALFTSGGQPRIDAGGALRFTPAPDANGVAHVTVDAHDDGGRANGGTDSSPPATFAISVVPVNDAPSFVGGSDVSVSAAAGAQTIAHWVASVSPGPANESTQSVGFSVTTSSDGDFTPSGRPLVGPDGTFRFTPAASARGIVTLTVRAVDDGGRTDGGVDTGVPHTFHIGIAGINAAPSFTPGADQTVNENAGPQLVHGWATGIAPGPADEDQQHVSFLISTTSPSLFAAGGLPDLAPDGTLTYRTADDANGSATVTVRAQDDGGTDGGGADTSAPASFVIHVLPVNSPPSFTAGAGDAVAEDSGPRSLAAWATAISAGPPDEAGQSVTFTVTTTSPGLFAAGGQPSVSPGGTLTYTPAPDANGSADVTVRAVDNGGVADGGVDTSSAVTVTITVTPVNDAPSFTAGAGDTVAEDSGPRTLVNWATAISPGPPDESGQALTFTVTTTNAGLFTAGGQPSVSPGGTLTYTPAPDANGSAAVTVRAVDGGGGTNTSAPATITITVTAVNDPPVATDDAPSVLENASGVTFDVLANDTDADAGTTLTVSSFDASGLDGSLTQGTGGGFTYVPSGSYNGTDTFTYVVDDGNGGTDTGTVTITVVPARPAVGGGRLPTRPRRTRRS